MNWSGALRRSLQLRIQVPEVKLDEICSSVRNSGSQLPQIIPIPEVQHTKALDVFYAVNPLLYKVRPILTAKGRFRRLDAIR
jgi:hypothetical protein